MTIEYQLVSEELQIEIRLPRVGKRPGRNFIISNDGQYLQTCLEVARQLRMRPEDIHAVLQSGQDQLNAEIYREFSFVHWVDCNGVFRCVKVKDGVIDGVQIIRPDGVERLIDGELDLIPQGIWYKDQSGAGRVILVPPAEMEQIKVVCL